MKKLMMSAAVVSTLSLLSIGHAGSMGPISSEALPCLIPFVSLEGIYTWDKFSAFIQNNNTLNKTNQPWGGRVSAGLTHPVSDKFSVNSELGGGYYSSIRQTVATAIYSSRYVIDGYDFLVGGSYKISRFDLFAKAGFMSQNFRRKVSKNLSEIPGGLYNGAVVVTTNVTQTLPEVKVGGLYNLNDNWGISLAYMHVFGASVNGTLSFSAAPSLITTNGSADLQNPTLDSLMLGLRYNIV